MIMKTDPIKKQCWTSHFKQIIKYLLLHLNNEKNWLTEVLISDKLLSFPTKTDILNN